LLLLLVSWCTDFNLHLHLRKDLKIDNLKATGPPVIRNKLPYIQEMS
jgi:hypothetical protein